MMFSSTIIPTIGRPTLDRAVQSVLNQTFTAADFEIIVVNDSGQPLPKAAWQESSKVRIINTNKRERSVARNAGAAIATGQYLHFLDDDDWMLPNAFDHFWQLAQCAPEAAWLYGGCRLIDRKETPIIDLQPTIQGNSCIQVMAGEWIPFLASLIKSESFFVAGGFHPNLTVEEDIDLCRRVALHGDFEGMTTVVACAAMGEEGSSTQYHPVFNSRWGREEILRISGKKVFSRMCASASSEYWWGRLIRVYLSSVIWNIQNKRIIDAFNRLFFGLGGFILASRYVFSLSFWQAIMLKYESKTFADGFRNISPI